MSAERELGSDERERLTVEYPALYSSVLAALFADDPIGIKFGTNTDEYEPEVGTILPRLKGCHSAEDVQNVVYEEFARWFGASAGSRGHYRDVAAKIWRLWNEYLTGK